MQKLKAKMPNYLLEKSPTGSNLLFIKKTNSRKKVCYLSYASDNTHTHTHTHLTALFLGLFGWAGTRKVQPIWILLKQETMSGSGISWAICKSAPRSRQTTTPAPHNSVFFTDRMPFLPPNQQHQSNEGTVDYCNLGAICVLCLHCSSYSGIMLSLIHISEPTRPY